MSGSPAEQHRADAVLAVGGDRAAFHRLVRTTVRLVLATVLLEVRDPDLADDLTQETYLRAWRAIGLLKDPSKFNAWLIGIARSACVDEHRTRSRKKRPSPGASSPDRPLQPVDEPVDQTDTPLDQLDQQERREQLIDALQSLPDPQRQVLAMRYLAGADYQTIATQLNLTDGALRGLLHRGLAAMRDRFPSLSPVGEGERARHVEQ